MAPNPPPDRVRTPPRTKPLLRGVSHQIAAFIALPAALALIASARGATGRAAAIVYGSSLVVLFAVSACYHRPFWAPRPRRIIGRIDHSAIFLLIAGTYTPFCLLLGPGAGHKLLAAVWAAAGLGILVVNAWIDAPKPVRAGIYVLFGWFFLPVLPAVRDAVGQTGLMLLLGGGFAYSAGAVIYALRRPDPFPTVFGFHEIFHLLVIAAAASHFAVVVAAIRVLG